MMNRCKARVACFEKASQAIARNAFVLEWQQNFVT